MVNVEKRVREETENMMFRMLEDINARLQSDITVKAQQKK